MPKAYTYTAEFNPISFADKIAPLKLYKEEYDKQQAAYEKLLEETADLGVLKDIAMDKASYNIYNNFKNDINSIATTMESEGLSPDVRNRLVELRKRRFTEIDPLLEKQKIRADLVKEQRKYRETHPKSIFDIDYDETPLDAITKESTFRPYDLNGDMKNIAETIYAGMLSNNGKDTVDYNQIRNQYNYSELSPRKQKIIDDTINLSKARAASAYQTYQDTIEMKKYQYRNRGSGKDSVGRGTSNQKQINEKNITLDNGDVVQVKKHQDGTWITKRFDGNPTVYNPPTEEEINEELKNEIKDRGLSITNIKSEDMPALMAIANERAEIAAAEKAKYGGKPVIEYTNIDGQKQLIVQNSGSEESYSILTPDRTGNKMVKNNPSANVGSKSFVLDPTGLKEKEFKPERYDYKSNEIVIKSFDDIKKHNINERLKAKISAMAGGKPFEEIIAAGKTIHITMYGNLGKNEVVPKNFSAYTVEIK